jgi:hypothetical protein
MNVLKYEIVPGLENEVEPFLKEADVRTSDKVEFSPSTKRVLVKLPFDELERDFHKNLLAMRNRAVQIAHRFVFQFVKVSALKPVRADYDVVGPPILIGNNLVFAFLVDLVSEPLVSTH